MANASSHNMWNSNSFKLSVPKELLNKHEIKLGIEFTHAEMKKYMDHMLEEARDWDLKKVGA